VSSLVFDLDQTLFDRQRALDNWISSLTICNSEQSHLRKLDQNGCGNREIFFAAVELLTGRKLDQQDFVRLLIRYIQPDHSLINYLRQLGKTYSIAILTNGGVYSQQSKIQSLSLHEVFPRDRVFISEEIGFEKPDRRAFDFVANALGIPANKCLYLGDSVETDVAPARSAGWKSQQIRSRSALIRYLVQLQRNVLC
jgi:putative hydrolase of the HAD superfamily